MLFQIARNIGLAVTFLNNAEHGAAAADACMNILTDPEELVNALMQHDIYFFINWYSFSTISITPSYISRTAWDSVEPNLLICSKHPLLLLRRSNVYFSCPEFIFTG